MSAVDQHVHRFDALEGSQRIGERSVQQQQFLFGLRIGGVDGEIDRQEGSGPFISEQFCFARRDRNLRRISRGVQKRLNHSFDRRTAAFYQKNSGNRGEGKSVRGRVIEGNFKKCIRRRFAQEHIFRIFLRLGQQALRGKRRQRYAENQQKGNPCLFHMRVVPRTYFALIGSSMIKVLPSFSLLSQRMSPSCSSTICLTMERPRPVPPVSRERALSTR